MNFISLSNQFPEFQYVLMAQPTFLAYSPALYVLPTELRQEPSFFTSVHGQVEPQQLVNSPTESIKSDSPGSQAQSEKPESESRRKRPRSYPNQEARKLVLRRNAITNIGNQVFTFLRMGRRNRPILERMFPDLSREELKNYYVFAKRLKESIRGYVTLEKLANSCFKDSCTTDEQLFQRIVRKLSVYYLRQKLPLALVTSKKLRSQSRQLHLSLRREIMALLDPK